MNETHIREQIEGLRHMTVGQLKYREAFGEESMSNHKRSFGRIAWRLQANAWGGLPKTSTEPEHVSRSSLSFSPR